jgi:hypothetical protein
MVTDPTWRPLGTHWDRRVQMDLRGTTLLQKAGLATLAGAKV